MLYVFLCFVCFWFWVDAFLEQQIDQDEFHAFKSHHPSQSTHMQQSGVMPMHAT